MCRNHQIVALATAVLGLAVSLCGQTPGPLIGRLAENQYLSPTGAFRVELPVSARLGGSVTDSENVVTFQDRFTTHQSIACFALDATQRHEDDARGRRDYLIWFLANFVQTDFEQRFPGARIESTRFLPDVQGGAFLAYNLLPGGSMFAHRIVTFNRETPPVAKRGNLLFVRDGHIYILSIELVEKATLGAAHTMTVAEEDAELLKRLNGLLGKIVFLDKNAQEKSAASAPDPAPAATAATAKPAG